MTTTARRRGIAQFEVTVREFSEALEKSRTRTAEMRGPTMNLLQDPEALRVAIEELCAQQEELTVADEELRAQLDELALASSRARSERDHYRELFDLSPDGYFVTDRLAVIRDVNAAGAAMVNIEPRFLVGKPLAALVDLADSRMMRSGIDQLRTGSTIELELRLRPRGGDSVWHTLKATVIETGTALLWIARDVHAQHTQHGTRDLGGSQDDVGSVPSGRIAQLERANRDKDELLERERHLREELAAADAAKDRFIGVLSHDFRAPLNAVIGWTQLLRREPLDHAARDRALATIERNAQAQVRLVEELLDISRIASNKVQLERTTLDLTDIVRRGVDSVLPVARERGVELDSVVSGGIVVFGDRARLDQVMAHLLSNALKFTSKGGRIIVLLERDGLHARITTQDTGRGIASELLPLVFDPFRQATDYATTTDRVGVGLYIVRRAVEMHGGTVAAQSDGVGRGARFTVLLPIVTSPAPGRTSTVPPPTEAELDGIRVLVADDDDDRRDLMASLLHQKGAAVTTANDVATALVTFDASPPDVVVADLAMSGRDGLALARELRARPGLAAALLAVSGFAAPEEVERAFAAGFDVHLAKPVHPAALVAAVREAAHSRRR